MTRQYHGDNVTWHAHCRCETTTHPTLHEAETWACRHTHGGSDDVE